MYSVTTCGPEHPALLAALGETSVSQTLGAGPP